MIKRFIYNFKKKRFCKLNKYNCPECIFRNFIYGKDGITFRGNRCLFGHNIRTGELNQYPCDVFLHNALRFIQQGEANVAYEEICRAITRSGGSISADEKKYLHKEGEE